jgi:hypothetical protein
VGAAIVFGDQQGIRDLVRAFEMREELLRFLLCHRFIAFC